jgi:hypothetical protein
LELAARETVGAVIEIKATSNEGCGAGVKKPPTHRKPNSAGRVHSIGAAPCGASWGKPGDRQPLGTGRCDTGGNRGRLLGLAPRGPPDRLARIDDRDGSSATRSRQKVCPAVYRGAGPGCRVLRRARRLGYLDSRRGYERPLIRAGCEQGGQARLEYRMLRVKGPAPAHPPQVCLCTIETDDYCRFAG